MVLHAVSWVRVLIAMLVVCPTVVPAQSDRAAAETMWVARSRPGASFGYSIDCRAEHSGFTEFLFAIAIDEDLGGVSLFTTSRHGNHSFQGRVARAMDVDVSFASPVYDHPAKVDRFRRTGTISGPTAADARLVWASWGDASTCDIEIDGIKISLSSPDGAQALHIGPRGFETGVGVQDGPLHVAAGVATVQSDASLVIGHLDLPLNSALGVVLTNSPGLLQPIATCSGPCSFAARAASITSIHVPISVDPSGSVTPDLLLLWIPEVSPR